MQVCGQGLHGAPNGVVAALLNFVLDRCTHFKSELANPFRSYSANQTTGHDVFSAAHTQLSLSYIVLVFEGGRVGFES